MDFILFFKPNAEPSNSQSTVTHDGKCGISLFRPRFLVHLNLLITAHENSGATLAISVIYFQPRYVKTGISDHEPPTLFFFLDRKPMKFFHRLPTRSMKTGPGLSVFSVSFAARHWTLGFSLLIEPEPLSPLPAVAKTRQGQNEDLEARIASPTL